jgi:hypothetical protein
MHVPTSTGFVLREGLQRCPAHPDRRPSLSIRRTAQSWLLHCFGGCRPEAVLAAVGLTWADLYEERWTPATRGPRLWRDVLEAPLLAHARRVQATLAPWLPLYHVNDFLRTERQRIAEARRQISILGDTEASWTRLMRLANEERVLSWIEAELDAALAEWR